jgi:acid phosphatase (class A)
VQLAPYYGINLNVLSSRTAKTPSYPSGHSTQSRLIAEIYAEKYPEHRTNLIKAAEECGGGRVMAGFHYPTDHKAGVYLAKRLFKSLKEKKVVDYDLSIDLTTSKGEK